jgi:hypothetical protein
MGDPLIHLLIFKSYRDHWDLDLAVDAQMGDPLINLLIFK